MNIYSQNLLALMVACAHIQTHKHTHTHTHKHKHKHKHRHTHTHTDTHTLMHTHAHTHAQVIVCVLSNDRARNGIWMLHTSRCVGTSASPYPCPTHAMRCPRGFTFTCTLATQQRHARWRMHTNTICIHKCRQRQTQVHIHTLNKQKHQTALHSRSVSKNKDREGASYE